MNNHEKYAVIIMGGGLEQDGSLSNHLIPRVERVVERYSSASLVVCSSSFSLNVPPKITTDGYVISEASVMARELKKKNVTMLKFYANNFPMIRWGVYFFALIYLLSLGVLRKFL